MGIAQAPERAGSKTKNRQRNRGRSRQSVFIGLFSELFNVAASRPAKSPRMLAHI
jgi:hypothetical protein